MRFDVLVNAGAHLSFLYQFEKTYRVILGTQLRFVTALNGVNLVGFTRPDAEKWFSLYATAALPVTPTFEVWLRFLIDVKVTATGSDGRIMITEQGREFLQWMVRESVSQDRPF
jgi:hypothetical protein